jgi:hypothetical protein
MGSTLTSVYENVEKFPALAENTPFAGKPAKCFNHHRHFTVPGAAHILATSQLFTCQRAKTAETGLNKT